MCNDIDLDRPQVRDELNHWGAWAAGVFGFDGFRMDAVKHMDYNFTRQFIEHVRDSRDGRFYAVGEYWSGDLDSLLSFIENTGGLLDLFDAPLHYNFHAAAQEEGSFDMSRLLDDTLVKSCPEHAVTLVDNHDSQAGSGGVKHR